MQTIRLSLSEALCRDIEAMCKANGTDASTVAGEFLVALLYGYDRFPQTSANHAILQSLKDGIISREDAMEKLDMDDLQQLAYLMEAHGFSFTKSHNSSEGNPNFAALLASRKG